MKKLLSTLIIFTLVLTLILPAYTYASSDINVTVNGKLVKFDQQPIIDQNNRTLVPIRFISEELGATVDWDGGTQTVTIIKTNKTITLKAGEKKATVNGETILLDTNVIIKNGRTLVPVRFVSEALDANVEWDNATQTVIITKDGYKEESPAKIVIPSDETIFNKTNLSEISTYGENFTYNNGKLLFNNSYAGLENYELDTTLNPNIEQQAKDTFKVLVDDNHYIELRYNTDWDGSKEDDSLILLGVTWGSKYAFNNQYLFYFMFYEKEAYNAKKDWGNSNFSENVVISLQLNQLFKDYQKGRPVDPVYEEKLRSTFVVLFGEKDGTDVFNYVLNEYLTKDKLGNDAYQGKLESKRFGNIQVDFGNDVYQSSSPLYFQFSYIK